MASGDKTILAKKSYVEEIDIRTFEPSVKPTLKFDFARNEAIIYDGAENSFVSKSVTQAVTDGDLVVSNGASNVYDARGRLAPVSANRPRLTFNPETGEGQGLLVEEARTNLRERPMSFESDIKNGTLTFQNAVPVSVNATSVFGSNTAIKIVNNSTPGSHQVNVNSTLVPDNSEYCTSFIIEYFGETPVVSIANGFFANYETRGGGSVNLDTGEVAELYTGAGTGTMRIEVTKIRDKVYQVSLCGAITKDNLGSPVIVHTYIQPRKIDNVSVYEGDGESGLIVHYHWVEKGSFPTSPIPEASTFVSRASTGTYYASAGTLQTAAIDEARYTYNPADLTAPPVLMDEVATVNLLANRTTMATEIVTVTSGETYTLSFDGTGSVQLSGADSTNVVGTGNYPNEARHTFTATSNSLTLTVTGSCTLGQLENSTYRTSWVDGSRSADVVSYTQSTRVADSVYRDLSGYEFGEEFSLYIEQNMKFNKGKSVFSVGIGNSSTEYVGLYNTASGQAVSFYIRNGNNIEAILTGTLVPYGNNLKFIFTYKPDGTITTTVNGVHAIGSTTNTMDVIDKILVLGGRSVFDVTECGIKDFKLYPKALSEAECLALTGGA